MVTWRDLIGLHSWLQRYKSRIGMTPDPSSLLRRGWPARLGRASLVPRPFEEGRRKGLVHTVCACAVTLRILGDRIFPSLVPSPKSPRGEGSQGDIGTVSWLYRRVISCQYYAINHVPVPRCHAMQCTIKVLRSHWLSAELPADVAQALLRDQMQGHMKIVELQSDWLSQK